MQLWKHPNGTFYVLYGPRLKRQLSTRTRNRGEADTFLAQFIAGSKDPLPESPTVGRLIEGYRADRVGSVRSRDALKYSCAALVSRLADLRPEHLTPATVQRYAKERGASAGTILRELGTLRAALAWAHERRWIASIPPISSPVKTPRPRDRWITQDEARRLLDGCSEHHIRLFVILGLMTVARMGAILEARWEQVDFERRLIDYGPGHGRKRRAVVPLNDEVLAALRGARELACSDYIVEYHGKPVRTVKKGFRAACERAGLSAVTPHILRHSGATWMASAGVPLAQIARMLGDTESTTEKVYAKHSPTYLAGAAAALSLQGHPKP